jgi:hypothetical protein
VSDEFILSFVAVLFVVALAASVTTVIVREQKSEHAACAAKGGYSVIGNGERQCVRLEVIK